MMCNPFCSLVYSAARGKASCHCRDANLARFLTRFHRLWMKKAVQRTQNKPPQMLHGWSGCLHLGHFGNICLEFGIRNCQLSTIEKSLLSNKASRTYLISIFSGGFLGPLVSNKLLMGLGEGMGPYAITT